MRLWMLRFCVVCVSVGWGAPVGARIEPSRRTELQSYWGQYPHSFGMMALRALGARHDTAPFKRRAALLSWLACRKLPGSIAHRRAFKSQRRIKRHFDNHAPKLNELADAVRSRSLVLPTPLFSGDDVRYHIASAINDASLAHQFRKTGATSYMSPGPAAIHPRGCFIIGMSHDLSPSALVQLLIHDVIEDGEQRFLLEKYAKKSSHGRWGASHGIRRGLVIVEPHELAGINDPTEREIYLNALAAHRIDKVFRRTGLHGVGKGLLHLTRPVIDESYRPKFDARWVHDQQTRKQLLKAVLNTEWVRRGGQDVQLAKYIDNIDTMSVTYLVKQMANQNDEQAVNTLLFHFARHLWTAKELPIRNDELIGDWQAVYEYNLTRREIKKRLGASGVQHEIDGALSEIERFAQQNPEVDTLLDLYQERLAAAQRRISRIEPSE